MDAVGRSYTVTAPDPGIARYSARLLALENGQTDWRTARILHVERVAPGTYEVVIQTGTQESVS